MKLTIDGLRKIIKEELNRKRLLEQRFLLSMEKGDFQDVMKGDPFDYLYDASADVFTVKGLNSKGQAVTGSRRARFDRAIGRKFGKGTKTYSLLMSRMRDGGYVPGTGGRATEIDTDPAEQVSAMDADEIGERLLTYLRMLDDNDLENLMFVIALSRVGDASVLEDAFNAAYPELQGSFSLTGLISSLNRDLARASKFMLKVPTPDPITALREMRELLQNEMIMNNLRMLLDSPDALSEKQKASMQRIKERMRPSVMQDYFEQAVGDFVQTRMREKTPFPGLRVKS